MEAKNQELQESQASSDSLKKSLRKKEKEGEEKDKEIAQLNKVISRVFHISFSSIKKKFGFFKAVKKAEIIRQDLETRLVESEKTAQETKEKLTKLEKIQEFIFELSSGKKKLFEEGKGWSW